MQKYEIRVNEKFNSTEVLFDGKPSAEVRERLKANGYKWHKVNGVWYGYLSMEDVKKVLNGEEVATAKKGNGDKQKQEELKQEYFAELSKKHDEKWLDYYKKETARVYKTIDGDYIALEKPRIKTSFCFGYSDSRYDTEDYDNARAMVHHARTQESYFLEENRKKVLQTIDKLESRKNEYSTIVLKLINQSYRGEKIYDLTYMRLCDWYDMSEERKSKYKDLHEVDRLGLIEEYKKLLVDFEKRLQTYLKKYGLSKLNCWSYWQDE